MPDPLTRAADAVTAARDRPLSRKRAMLAALLIDAAVDALATETRDDPLALRARLAQASEPLDLILALAAMTDDGPRLVLDTVEVPLADYPDLPVDDFMVSLYNAHTVQRLRLATPDGSRHDVHEMLSQALAALW